MACETTCHDKLDVHLNVHRNPRPLVARSLAGKRSLIFGVLGGRSYDTTYQQAIDDVTAITEEMRDVFRFSPKPNRRGQFSSFSVGISYGGGQTVSPLPTAVYPPLNICQTVRNLAQEEYNVDTIQTFLRHRSVVRVANFASRASS